jgi:riboflavin synthase
MFSGIVETTARILSSTARDQVLEIQIERPASFTDLSIGDSIAVNGICLTLEKFDSTTLTFALGAETLRVTGWDVSGVNEKVVNLERSLRLNDRIHGHLVTGHVDALGTVKVAEQIGEGLRLTIEFPKACAPYIWSKGSIAINGVSLTLNATSATEFEVGLIPETLKRTNLGKLKVGERVNLEIDNMARGLVHFAKVNKELQL